MATDANFEYVVHNDSHQAPEQGAISRNSLPMHIRRTLGLPLKVAVQLEVHIGSSREPSFRAAIGDALLMDASLCRHRPLSRHRPFSTSAP